MQQSLTWSEVTTSTDCFDPLVENFINFDFSTSDVPVHHGTWHTAGVTSSFSGDEEDGCLWNPSSPDDLNDLWVNGSDLSDYLSGGSVGTTPVIRIVFYDGITTMTAVAPIIIEYPAIPAATYPPVSTTVPPSYLTSTATGYPIGTPWPSYDMYEYTITGNETWTPTNNPIVKVHGDGSTVSTIRIQHKLTIDPGADLTLDGVRVEMGPAAKVEVKANTPTNIGGHLGMHTATLTAYRGCNVSSPATDTSTWGGILLSGNTMPQGTSWYYNSEPKLTGYNLEVSYADVGLQNGTGTMTGGAILLGTSGSLFLNNREHVRLLPYRNMSGSVEMSSYASFGGCTFKNDADAWFSSPDFINVNGIKGFSLYSTCSLVNNTGRVVPFGVYGFDAGIAITNSVFQNFGVAVNAGYASPTRSLFMTGCVLDNNNWGLGAYAAIAPVVTGNTFNVPKYTATPGTYYRGTSVLVIDDQTIGALIDGSTGYNLTSNIFQTNAAVTPGNPYGYFRYTTGTIQYSTGSDPNQVTNNTFTGLGVAMNSNFINNNYGTQHGLRYLCNTDTRVGYDIAVVGTTVPDGGINEIQYSSSVPTPAGNKFSVHTKIGEDQQPITYYYNSVDPSQDPNVGTAHTYGSVSATALTNDAICYVVPGGSVVGIGSSGGYLVSGGSVVSGGNYSVSTDVTLKYAIACANANYYMNATDTVPHRDSLYYWARLMQTAYGDLLVADLLIEDSLIDSANVVYDSIIAKYSLTGTEANDFTWGRYIMDILIYDRVNNIPRLSLSSNQIASLQAVKANTTMWAHARSESWLHAYNGESLTDTLLYPVDTAADSTGDKITPHTTLPQTISENKVFPNPTHDLLQVMYTAVSAGDVSIRIEDITGRVVLVSHITSGIQSKVDLSKLVPGIYIYIVFWKKRRSRWWERSQSTK